MGRVRTGTTYMDEHALPLEWFSGSENMGVASHMIQPQARLDFCGQCLCQASVEVGLAVCDRELKDVFIGQQGPIFVRTELGDVAVFERAVGEGKIFSLVVDQDRAFHEFAFVVSGKGNSATKVKRASLKSLCEYDALF